MRKLCCFTLLLILILSFSFGDAEDLGVQIIGGESNVFQPASLDDMQLGETYEIANFAKLSPIDYLFVDFFAQFNKDADYYDYIKSQAPDTNHVFVDKLNENWFYNWKYRHASWKESGENADFAWLRMDITNLQKASTKFLEDTTVKMIYQDEYEFAGWARQVNYDYMIGGKEVVRYSADTVAPTVIVLDPANEEPQGMLYTGTYIFGCTLPNSVVMDTKSPLRYEISIADNELTFHIRR